MWKSNALFTMLVTVGWRWLPWCWLNGPSKHSETEYCWIGKLYLPYFRVVRGKAIRALEEHYGQIWDLKVTLHSLILNLERALCSSEIKIRKSNISIGTLYTWNYGDSQMNGHNNYICIG